jgi:integrase
MGPAQSVTVAAAIEEFLADKRRAGRRHRTLEQLGWMLGKLPQEAPLASLDARALESVLDGLGYEGITRDNFRRAWRNLFNWSRRRGYAGARNPAEAITPHQADAPPPSILTVKQAKTLLGVAREQTPDFLPYILLTLFAGIRPEEATRLDWSAVGESEIVIGPEVSKTRRQRHVAIEPVLAEWLKLTRQRKGRIWGCAYSTTARRRKKLREALKWKDWPQDVLRHTFASYHLARGQDAAKTAHQLGHPDAGVLFRHYRAPARGSEAAEFWGLSPEKCPGIRPKSQQVE